MPILISSNRNHRRNIFATHLIIFLGKGFQIIKIKIHIFCLLESLFSITDLPSGYVVRKLTLDVDAGMD